MTLDSTDKLTVAAWEPTGPTTWPAIGTYDVSCYRTLAGFAGLKPLVSPMVNAELTFRWHNEPDGSDAPIVKGFPLTSSIPSTAQFMQPNLGPYVQVGLQPYRNDGAGQPSTDPLPFAMRLFGTNRTAHTNLILGDQIQVDVKDVPLAANAPPYIVYPAGYYGGPLRVYFRAPAGWLCTLYGFDLTCQWWPLDDTGPATVPMVAPCGAWFLYVTKPLTATGKFTLAATPQVT